MKTEETTQPGGEKALIEQIANLQKQLDECLESDFKWVRDEVFADIIHNTIAAQFMPVTQYNSYCKEWVTETPTIIWIIFRASIFESDKSAHLLQSQAFRDVIWCMNNFISDIGRENAGFELFTSSAEMIVDNTTAEGWALALEALDLTREDFTAAGYQWLRLSIRNIQRCVKMYHEAPAAEETK